MRTCRQACVCVCVCTSIQLGGTGAGDLVHAQVLGVLHARREVPKATARAWCSLCGCHGRACRQPQPQLGAHQGQGDSHADADGRHNARHLHPHAAPTSVGRVGIVAGRRRPREAVRQRHQDRAAPPHAQAPPPRPGHPARCAPWQPVAAPLAGSNRRTPLVPLPLDRRRHRRLLPANSSCRRAVPIRHRKLG